jgi:hypothetical protein
MNSGGISLVMRKFILINYLLISASFAHEDDKVVIVSDVGGTAINSSPSDKFIKEGKTLNFEDKFQFKLEEVIKSAKIEALNIPKFSKKNHVASLSMQVYPNPFSNHWFFVVTIIDEDKNIARIVVNTNYKSWKFGEVHDDFDE